MSSAIYNHRSLQPTGASGQIAAATQHAHGRLEQSFEAIKHEFDTLAADLGLLRNQRDDYDQKVSAQINELNIIRQSLFELETQQSKVRQQYEDELTHLRQELHTLRTENVRMNMAAAAASAVGQQAPLPPPPSSLGGGGGGGGGGAPPSAVPSASASGPGGAYGGPGGPPVGESASAAGGGYYAGASGPLPPPPGAGGPSVSGQASLRELKEREQREYEREREMRQHDREREQRGRERDRDREREQRDRERERERDRDLRMGGIGSLDRERSMRDREQRERDLLRGDRDDRMMRDRMSVDERERLPDLRDPKRVKTDVKRGGGGGGGGDMYTSPLPTPNITKQQPPSSYTPAPQSEPQNGLALVPSSAQGIIPGSAIPDDADVPPEFRKEGSDYFVLFNPKLPRSLDVSLVHTLMHESVVCCVRFSHDGKYLATGCNRTAQIYDTKTGAKVCVLVDESAGKAGSDLYIRSVCFSPDGKYLATGAEDKQIRIWDISKKRICNVFDGHQQEIYSLDFSLDGRLIVSGSGDKTARIWTMNTDGSNSGGGSSNNNSGSSTGGSTAGSSSGSAANSASGNSATTSSNSSKVLTINDAEPNNDAGVTSVAISPNGALVAAGSLDTIVRIWDVNTGQLVERLRGHRDSVYSVAFTPDGRGLVSGSLDKTLKYWDVSALANGVKGAAAAASAAAAAAKNGAEAGKKDSVGNGVAEKSICTMNFAGHKDYVLSVAVSHDGKWVVSGSKDRGVQFWDSHTAMAHCMLQGHKNSVISIDLSPAGNMLATGSGDWQARIWKYSDTRYDPK